MKRRKIKIPWLCLILIGGAVFFIPSVNFGKGNIISTQGLINPGGNPREGYLLINEMRIYLDPATQILDHQGRVLKPGELKPKKWVYVEVEKDPARRILKARKIYLLPHYVGPKQKKQYAFMK